MNTIGGLVVHLQDVHKEHTNVVPNSIGGRETIDIEIFGMEGIPYEDLERHIQEKSRGEKRKYEDPEELKRTMENFNNFTANGQQAVAERNEVTKSPEIKKIRVEGAVLVYSSDISPVIILIGRESGQVTKVPIS